MSCSRSRRAFSISSRSSGLSNKEHAALTRWARAAKISSGVSVSSLRVMPWARAVDSAVCTIASGSRAAMRPLPSSPTAMPPLIFSMRALALSSSCLFKRTRRLARERMVSSSRWPIATPSKRSLSATPGFFSSGRLSVLRLFSTPTASMSTKRSLAPSALLLTRFRPSASRLRTPRPFICS